MNASEEAVRRRWAALVGKPVVLCPHGRVGCAPCERDRERQASGMTLGQPLKAFCPQGHLKDGYRGKQLICSECRRADQARYRQRKRASQKITGLSAVAAQ